MKAAQLSDYQLITIEDLQTPTILPNEVLIQSIYVGLCGSEIHAYLGTHPFREPPSILGHEVLGRVVAIGSGVTQFTEGDLVTVEPHIGCGRCSYCQSQKYNLCNEKIVLGTKRWSGAFAQYFTAPEQTVYKINSKQEKKIYTLVEPLAVGLHAVNRVQLSKNSKVLVLGAGPIGILTAIAAISQGVEQVVITDTVDLNLEIAKQMTTLQTLNVITEDIHRLLVQYENGFDAIFVSVGVSSVIQQAIDLCKKDGAIISIALYEKPVAVDFNKIMLKEIHILGSSMYVKKDIESAIKIVEENHYKLDKLITKCYDFHELQEAFENNIHNASETIKTIIKFK